MTSPLATLDPTPLLLHHVERATVTAGQELELFSATGPGHVVSTWLAVGGGNVPTLDARLRVYHDGSPVPDLDADLGTLLAWHWGADGEGLTAGHVHSGYRQATADGSFLLTLPLPFGAAGIRVAYYLPPSAGPQVADLYSMVAYRLTPGVPDDGRRLRSSGARWADQAVTRGAGDVTVLLDTATTSLSGPGSLVYLAYVGGVGAANRSWLERNLALYVDGEAAPSVETTGTEDTFDSGWYYHDARDVPLGPHSYVGTDGPASQPACVGQVTDLWTKWGGVPFATSLRAEFLTEDAVTTGDSLCWLALYYR